MNLAHEYAASGFVVCEGLCDRSIVESLRVEAARIVDGRVGKVRGAFPGQRMEDVLAIHFPHKISPVMRETLRHPPIVAVLTELIGPDVKCMQSMLFVKSAGKPGQAWHQDEAFIPTQDASLVGAWIALDDATIDNGCLWMQPGSHAQRHLWPLQAHADARFDSSPEATGFNRPREGGVAVEVKAGTVAFFNGFVLHRSLDNRRTNGFRRALVNHYMSAHSLLPWSFGQSRFAPHDYRDIELVAGIDPYADRGTEDIAEPYVRPERPVNTSS